MDNETKNTENNNESQANPQRIGTRSKALNRLMVVPIVMALGLAVATGVLVLKMTEERVATGQRVTVELEGECIESAQSTILARAEAVGVGAPAFDGSSLTMTLPDIPNAKADIPKLLFRSGRWTMRDGDTVILSSDDVASATLSMDEAGMPETLLSFDPAAKQEAQLYLDQHEGGSTDLWMDDEKIISRPNSILVSDEFRLVSTNTEPKVRMKESVDFVILLSNPVIGCQIQWTVQE